MADTPTEGSSETKPAARRARKPRAASASASSSGTPTATKPTSARAKSTRTGAKRTTKRASAAKAGAAAKSSTSTSRSRKSTASSPVARVARTVQDRVAAVTPSSGRKKAAAFAAVAGIAAGVATFLGRRKISQAASEAIDAVSGNSESDKSAPEKTPDSGNA